jgi:hypothetical protein
MHATGPSGRKQRARGEVADAGGKSDTQGTKVKRQGTKSTGLEAGDKVRTRGEDPSAFIAFIVNTWERLLVQHLLYKLH